MSSILEGIINEGEQVLVLYIDGKPAVKFVDRNEAKQALDFISKKHPEKKFELKSEIRGGIGGNEKLDEDLRKWFKEKWVRFGPDGKIRGACARGDDSEGKPKCLPQKKAQALGKKGRKYAANKKRREDPNPERHGKAINVATKKKTTEEVVPFAIPNIEKLKKLAIEWNEFSNLEDGPAMEEIEHALLKKGYSIEYSEDGDTVEVVHIRTGKKVSFPAEILDEVKCWSGYTRVKGVPAGAPGSCKKKTNEERTDKCPHCGGELVSEEMINEKKDACYYKVKSRYKVWPSAYASGALVKCRKKGASNWGTGGKKNESSVMKGIIDEIDGPELGRDASWQLARRIKKATGGEETAVRDPKTGQLVTKKITGKNKAGQENTNEAKEKFSRLYPDPSDPDFDMNDPVVNIIGIGTLNLSTLKKKAVRECAALLDELKAEKYEAAAYHVDQFHRTLKSLGEALEELENFNRAGETVKSFFNKNKPVDEDTDMRYAAEKTPAENPYGGSPDRQFRGAISETPTDNPTGASGEGGWRTYRPKPAGEIEEDTAYAGGMGQGGNAGQSYRKFKPKMAGVIKKENAIMKGLRNEGR